MRDNPCSAGSSHLENRRGGSVRVSMGSFPSREEEQAAVEEAAEHYEFYEWASITLACGSIASTLFNMAELYVIASSPPLRRNTAMLLMAGIISPYP